MFTFNKTAIVYNEPNKIVGLPPYYYRLRSCDTNLNGNTPADQYQKLKLIQNTVRVPSSLYSANLGPLTAYRKPTTATYNVCWNQMSDRPVPSVQRVTVPTGQNNSMNSRRHSVTSSKPGCQTPGGKGCDIKHNSYDRYLNRLKGKGPMRRGVVPPAFGAPIPFNPAYPVYGGKTMKTSIIDDCDCPIDGNQVEQNERIYNDPLYQEVPQVPYGFNNGTYVYAMQSGNNFYTRAIVLSSSGDNYTIQFDNGTIEHQNVYELKIYFPCNCNTTINGVTYTSGEFITISLEDQVQCTFPSSLFLS
jgi:hypothetical protein